jgi:hypothetical protein
MKKSLEDYRQSALKAFQLLRRMEESYNGIGVCISCGKKDLISRMQGGHYISRRCRATELEVDNVNIQCIHCNQFLGGNVLNYRDNLIEKIGLERVERLEDLYRAWQGSDEALERLSESDRLLLKKKTKSDYMELEKKFKEKIKELKNDQ